MQILILVHFLPIVFALFVLLSMIEKEVKILDVPYTLLCERLQEMGAEKLWSKQIHDRYCDTPDGQLAAQGMRVRVRQEGDHVVITTKSKTNKTKKHKKSKKYATKTRREEDTMVPSLEAAWAVIGVMGLEVVREKHKIRISYRLDETSVCDVDFYDGLPPVVEIESTKRKAIYAWIDRLGLSDYRVTTWGSQKLFAHYGNLDIR